MLKYNVLSNNKQINIKSKKYLWNIVSKVIE